MTEEVAQSAETQEQVSQPVQETAQAPKQETETKEDSQESFVPFPKKALNLIQRKDRQIGKLRAQLAQFQKDMDSFKSSQPKAQEDSGPKESDFETYGEYLQAKTLWEVEKKMAAASKAQSEKQQSDAEKAKKDSFVNERVQAIAQKAQEHTKTYPDLPKLAQENAQFLDGLDESVQMAFYHPKVDAALAFYNLAKSGRLYELADMDAQEALLFLYENSKPAQAVSKAPKPLQAASGTGTSKLGNIAEDPDATRKYLQKIGVR